jgi:hypothetical protein
MAVPLNTEKNNIVKVAGIWEQGWNTPWLEHDLWIQVVNEFAANGWYMTPVSGIAKSSTLVEVVDMQEVIDANPDLTVVWVDEKGDIPLQKFEHPQNALYIMGRTSQTVLGMRRDGDPSVRIETIGGFWAHQALAIVLYDRMKKSWQ